jgi:short-subunit dehydrogenase
MWDFQVGLAGRSAHLDSLLVASRRLLEINSKGTFILARAVIEGCVDRYGKIITVGSVMANTGDPRSLHFV